MTNNSERRPFLVVPKPAEGWPDREQKQGEVTYRAIGGSLYVPEDPTSTELQKLYAYWATEHEVVYDKQNGWIEAVGLNAAKLACTYHSSACPIERVLDVACGTGLVSRGLRMSLPADARYSGIDVTYEMLETARRKPELAGVPFVQADVRALPLRAASFDLAVGSLFINHLPAPDDRTSAYAEMARVMRPGGILILIDTPNNPDAELVGKELNQVFPVHQTHEYTHYSDNAPNGFPLVYHVMQLPL